MVSAAPRICALLAALVLPQGAAIAANAQLVTLPVPISTIYPGELIDAGSLSDHTFIQSRIGSGYAGSAEMLIGKIAKRTLLPEHPIPTNAVGEVDLVQRGTSVQLVFQQAGLVIMTYASPLEDGSAGDMIRLRNIDSGATVVGVVQPDGSVRVGMR